MALVIPIWFGSCSIDIGKLFGRLTISVCQRSTTKFCLSVTKPFNCEPKNIQFWFLDDLLDNNSETKNHFSIESLFTIYCSSIPISVDWIVKKKTKILMIIKSFNWKILNLYVLKLVWTTIITFEFQSQNQLIF